MQMSSVRFVAPRETEKMLETVVVVFHLLAALGVVAWFCCNRVKVQMLVRLSVQVLQILYSEAKVPLPFLVSLLLYLPPVSS